MRKRLLSRVQIGRRRYELGAAKSPRRSPLKMVLHRAITGLSIRATVRATRRKVKLACHCINLPSMEIYSRLVTFRAPSLLERRLTITIACNDDGRVNKRTSNTASGGIFQQPNMQTGVRDKSSSVWPSASIATSWQKIPHASHESRLARKSKTSSQQVGGNTRRSLLPDR